MKTNKQHFILTPFVLPAGLSPMTITGSLSRHDNVLNAGFEINGDPADIEIPGISETGTRKDRLWERTCFELFIAAATSPSYWEFNFSPDGHWNAYRFRAYREGMAEESAFTSLQFRVQRNGNKGLSCIAEIDLRKIGLDYGRIETSPNAVIRHRDNTLSHWSAAHCSGRPDFHLRDSFVIIL